MIANSDKLAELIRGMKAAERAAAASVTAFFGMSSPVFQILKALQEAGGMSRDWALCEAPISQAGKMAVLLFRGSEKDVCDEIHKLVQVAQVQAS